MVSGRGHLGCENGLWVPAPDQVGGRPFAGMTGVFAEMTEGCGWSRVRMEVGYFHVNYGLVGGGDEGLGPRFRGDDGGVGVRPS